MSLLDQIEAGLGALVIDELRKVGELVVHKITGDKTSPTAKKLADAIATKAATAIESAVSERAAGLAALQDATNRLAAGAQGVLDEIDAAEKRGRARMTNALEPEPAPAPLPPPDSESP